MVARVQSEERVAEDDPEHEDSDAKGGRLQGVSRVGVTCWSGIKSRGHLLLISVSDIHCACLVLIAHQLILICSVPFALHMHSELKRTSR